jgi:hypothetical protein
LLSEVGDLDAIDRSTRHSGRAGEHELPIWRVIDHAQANIRIRDRESGSERQVIGVRDVLVIAAPARQ